MNFLVAVVDFLVAVAGCNRIRGIVFAVVAAAVGIVVGIVGIVGLGFGGSGDFGMSVE